MKQTFEDQSTDLMHRDDFQGKLDFFNGRYMDFFQAAKAAYIFHEGVEI